MRSSPTPLTLFEKLWRSHAIIEPAAGPALLYIDLHLVHEVTSPQAFDGLRQAGRKVRRPDLTVATADHNVPTTTGRIMTDPIAMQQVETLRRNCDEFNIKLFDMYSADQGIVHVIAPELGLTLPGMTIVCGDSHTSTHGAFGALAFGIGTSEVEHVLATQCLPQQKPKTMQVLVEGRLPYGVTAKDLALGIIAQIGTDGATGHVVEYAGDAVLALSMEGRMTLCNLTIEAGARAGLIAPDEVTFEYIRGRRFAPKEQDWEQAVEYWRTLPSDANAHFDKVVRIQASSLAPFVTWGTSPGMAAPINALVPDPGASSTAQERDSKTRALEYMGLKPGTRLEDITIDRVFIGSCTNGRLEDLREAAQVVRGYTVDPRVHALVVPGSQAVKRAAESEGIDKIFQSAGFEWREAGCSMCLGMNPDILRPGERCASTSNRNFEGRQGRNGRTHLLAPAMAAAAAITGRFTDVREWKFR